jgi:capsular polysaccharide biosynthesis protein
MFGLSYYIRQFPWLHRRARAAKQLVASLKRHLIEIIRGLPRPFSMGLPRGFYSDYDLLTIHPPAIRGRVILIDQGCPPTPSDSITVLAGRRQHSYQPWPIFWTQHHEVELVGTSLAHINDKDQLCAEAVYGRLHALDGPAYNSFRRSRRSAVRMKGNWTSLVSRWMSTDRTWPYGHWLKDALPRLAVLKELPPDTRIILPPTKLPYMVESLGLMGLLDRCRWTSETHLLVENYYFSSPPSMIACYSPYTVEFLRATFLPLVKPDGKPTPKRFYLKRNGDVRNVANEAEVLEFFRRLGWEIVDAATMSFSDQIRLFAGAEAISGPSGSGVSNLIWCNPGCKVLEIFGDAHMCAVAEWVSHCLPPMQYRYLIFPADHKLSAIVDMDRLKKAMAAFDLM